MAGQYPYSSLTYARGVQANDSDPAVIRLPAKKCYGLAMLQELAGNRGSAPSRDNSSITLYSIQIKTLPIEPKMSC